jgi:hypothetical protein
MIKLKFKRSEFFAFYTTVTEWSNNLNSIDDRQLEETAKYIGILYNNSFLLLEKRLTTKALSIKANPELKKLTLKLNKIDAAVLLLFYRSAYTPDYKDIYSQTIIENTMNQIHQTII